MVREPNAMPFIEDKCMFTKTDPGTVGLTCTFMAGQLLGRKETCRCVWNVETRELHCGAMTKFIEECPMNLSNACYLKTRRDAFKFNILDRTDRTDEITLVESDGTSASGVEDDKEIIGCHRGSAFGEVGVQSKEHSTHVLSLLRRKNTSILVVIWGKDWYLCFRRAIRMRGWMGRSYTFASPGEQARANVTGDLDDGGVPRSEDRTVVPCGFHGG
jgi:hypothetical protein